MTPGPVVVGYDAEEGGRATVRRAIALAGETGAREVILVCTEDRPPDFSSHRLLGMRVRDLGWTREWNERVRRELAHELKYVRMSGLQAKAICTLDSPDELVARVAAEAGASCIVVFDPGHGAVYELFFGSLHRLLRRRTTIPIVTVSEGRESSRFSAA